MAMMTGHLLLVGAICVLWCGAVFGHAMDDYCSEGGGNGLRHTSNSGNEGVSIKADCGLLSARVGLINAVEAGEKDGEGLSGGTGPLEKTKETLQDNKLENKTLGKEATGSGGGGVAVQPPAALPLGSGGSDTEEQRQSEQLDTKGKEAGGKGDEKDGKTTESQQKRADQPSSSGSDGPQGGKEPNLKEKSESTESSVDTPTQEDEVETEETNVSEEETGGDEENNNNVALTVTSESQAKLKGTQTATPPTLPTTQVNERSRTEDLGHVQQPKGVQSDIESNSNSQTEGAAPITANQHNEPSADHAGSRPPSPTANGDAANNEADKSTEVSTPNNDPAADGTGTREEKQNENREANPKESVPATNATTAATGDSDSSTAVPHTTFPLLLLLFVACAAAASAVVAA
ncbi:Mucin-associated surface protein (MASP) subgroup S102 [Trypanosoma cruzi]|uniref:Mucin-associated surface protein (MASP) subgroup S102 n=1 Tax=Trypanosoma cruzi TaxID=5693 RepID=A0A7J6XKF8_TRYCR|nr:Mucin-associated surface protein (MASP) subgroup S102 [Trypanosoma cruzi]